MMTGETNLVVGTLSGILVYLPWLVLVVAALPALLRVVRATMQQSAGGEVSYTLRTMDTTLNEMEQRLQALERHAEHEREIRTLMLERLTTRSRTTRKTSSRMSEE